MSDMSERLAREVRAALGPNNNDELPVTHCVAALTARVAELEAALKRYSWHGGGQVMCESVKGSAYPCTCGLEKILTGFADGAVQK